MMIELTEFQRAAEQAVRRQVAKYGVSDIEREVYHGEVPFLGDEPQTSIKLTFDDVEIWRHDDEAGIGSSDKSEALEKWDFDDAEG